MTSPTPESVDPELLLGLWISVPALAEGDPEAWAEIEAGRWAATLGEAGEKGRVRAFLTALAQAPRPEGFSWRLVLIVDPGLGAAVFDVALLTEVSAEDRRALVGADLPSLPGSDVSEFEHPGITGLQAVRFTVDDAEDENERAIAASVGVVVTGDFLSEGQVTVLARGESVHLEPLIGALTPLRYLLTSPALPGVLEGTTGSASDDSVRRSSGDFV